MARLRIVVGLAVLPLVYSCGSSPSSPSTADAIISIGPSGIAPSEVRIKAWGQVQFVNNDTRPHSILSDPIDVHSECPPVNFVGTLQPGETRNTGTLSLPRTCRFHDHLYRDDPTLRGRIVVE
jgi:hypothetical protein